MAILQITEDWRIDSDPYNWIVQKRSIIAKSTIEENIGKENWRNEGYYPTLPAAVKALVNAAIKIPEGVLGVVDKLDELYCLVNERFTSETCVQAANVVKEVEEIEEDDLEDFLS